MHPREWGIWLTQLPSPSLWYLDSPGCQVKCHVAGKREILHPSGRTCFPHLCAWEDPGTDPHKSSAKAHGKQGGDLRQPARLHPGLILPDQPNGLLWWNAYVSGQGKGYRDIIWQEGMSFIWISVKPLARSLPTSFSLNWRLIQWLDCEVNKEMSG